MEREFYELEFERVNGKCKQMLVGWGGGKWFRFQILGLSVNRLEMNIRLSILLEYIVVAQFFYYVYILSFRFFMLSQFFFS